MDKATSRSADAPMGVTPPHLPFSPSDEPRLAPSARSRPAARASAPRPAKREQALPGTMKGKPMTAHSIARREPSGDARHHQDQTWFEAVSGERLAIRVHSHEVGGKFAILENVVDHGAATPIHVHAEDEVFHVLEGEVIFSMNNRVCLLVEGSEIVVPAGTPHGWRNKSGRQARMLVFFAPGGIEEMFLRAGGLTPAEVVELAADYGTLLVGPPIPD